LLLGQGTGCQHHQSRRGDQERSFSSCKHLNTLLSFYPTHV
jgi:hypothetical protein